MAIEFLIDESRKEIEKLDKLIKELGVAKKQDSKSIFLKRFMAEVIRAKHHALHAEKHQLDRIRPETLRSSRRQIPYFKPHEIHKLTRLPEKKKFLTISEKEYPILKAGNYVLVRAVVNNEYKIIEPVLTALDIRIINDIKARGIKDDEAIISRLKTLFASLGTQFSQDYFEKIKYYINRNDAIGKIMFMMQDDKVKMISCPGTLQAVRVIYNGRDLETDIAYNKAGEINEAVKALANMAGESIDENNPVLDAVMQNGTRMQGILGNDIVSPKFVITK